MTMPYSTCCQIDADMLPACYRHIMVRPECHLSLLSFTESGLSIYWGRKTERHPGKKRGTFQLLSYYGPNHPQVTSARSSPGGKPLFNAKMFKSFHTSRLLLPEPSSSRHLKRKRGVLSKLTSLFQRQSTTPLGYSYVQFQLRRGLSGRSYDLQFDHKVPVFSLKQMINAGKLEYDYPVYWTPSLTEEKIDIASTTHPTRRLKKDKIGSFG